MAGLCGKTVRQDIQMLIHRLQICLIIVWKLNSNVLRSLHHRWRSRSGHLLLKYSIIFGHKSNTSFQSVKTLHLCAVSVNLHIFVLIKKKKKKKKTNHCITDMTNIQWDKKVFSQPPIVQVLPLKKMREACNFHHKYTSTMRDKIRKKNPENHIVGFLKNLFANYGGK